MLKFDAVRDAGVGPVTAGLISRDKECGLVLGVKEVTRRI